VGYLTNADYISKILIAKLCNTVECISYNCELLTYCYMRFILIRSMNWASPRTWLSKFTSQNCLTY